jgi:hypothetical protein
MGLVLLAGGVLAGIDFVREGLGSVRGG